MEYYLIIQDMTSDDLNNLLTACGLASWRICDKTESSFEAKWHITFSMTRALKHITETQYNECVGHAEVHYPAAWSHVAMVLETMKRYPGYNISPVDSYQKLSASIFQISEYFEGKVYGLMGMVNSVWKIGRFRAELEKLDYSQRTDQ